MMLCSADNDVGKMQISFKYMEYWRNTWHLEHGNSNAMLHAVQQSKSHSFKPVQPYILASIEKCQVL